MGENAPLTGYGEDSNYRQVTITILFDAPAILDGLKNCPARKMHGLGCSAPCDDTFAVACVSIVIREYWVVW